VNFFNGSTDGAMLFEVKCANVPAEENMHLVLPRQPGVVTRHRWGVINYGRGDCYVWGLFADVVLM
jgi:hypothetical protein